MNLPKPELDRDSAMKLWKETRSEYAKEQVILANQALVANVLKKLNLNALDDDLFSTGIIGLVKALNLFNPDGGFEFSTYAVPLIRNEILMIFRKKRIDIAVSLDDDSIFGEEDGDSYQKIISDGKRFENDVITSITVKKILDQLNEKDQEVFMLIYEEGKTYKEIAEKYGQTKENIARIVKKIRRKYRKELE